MRGRPARSPGDLGSVAISVVIFLPIFLLALGLVIDVGILFVQRQELCAAADMAVLAGSREIDLDRLAQGERYLLPDAAAQAARSWFASNLATNRGPDATPAAVTVRVINASAAAPGIDPATGRRLVDPTVCLTADVPTPLYFLSFIIPTTNLHVHADASLLERK